MTVTLNQAFPISSRLRNQVSFLTDASPALCRYFLEGEDKKFRLLLKQVSVCIQYVLSKTVHLIRDDADNAIDADEDYNLDDEFVTKEYKKLLDDEFDMTLSAMIRAMNELHTDEKKIDVHDPGMNLISFVHDSSKYHPNFVRNVCNRPIFSKSYRDRCLRWSEESMYGTHADWSWGIILPNMTGAPSLPPSPHI